MILDLDHDQCLDPERVGAKAAWLARARRSQLPVLPGLVVTTKASQGHMRLGTETLAGRGSGGARLAITSQPLPFGDELAMRSRQLGPRLVARSSTALEGTDEFSGAFTSYLDLDPDDLAKAITGCWASAFSVAALQRLEAAGIEAGSVPMAVLVQPALDPVAGGTASIDEDGTVVVIGVKGSPATLLQGWSTGLGARSLTGGGWEGPDLVDLIGEGNLDALAALMATAREQLGANRCEWALDDEIVLLQLGVERPAPEARPRHRLPGESGPELTRLARTAMLFPGALGEELVLPWALAGLPPASIVDRVPHDPMARALELRDRLVEEVWSMPAPQAMTAAQASIRDLLGDRPRLALARIRELRPPDPSRAGRLLALVGKLLAQSPQQGSRFGVGRWEPFVASVALTFGTPHHGVGAAPGIGAGLLRHVSDPHETGGFPRRCVIAASQPIPNLAPLIWDAAGIATETGSPAAHLFESARSLGVPAVCGVVLPPGEAIVAVDGSRGVVASLPMEEVSGG